MKAVVLHKYGGPNELRWEDFKDPELGPDEVLVKVAAASINPVDYKMRSGEAKERFPVEFPGILGRDVSGTVAAVGEDVTSFAEGDRVFATARQTYAQLVAVKANELARIPDDLDIVDAAALPLVLLTGEQLMMRGVAPAKGSTVLVAGAIGGVGRTAIYVAKQAGATVIAGVKKSQLAEAKSLGADTVVALDDSDALARIGFLDGVADAVGGKTAEQLLGKVKQGRRLRLRAGSAGQCNHAPHRARRSYRCPTRRPHARAARGRCRAEAPQDSSRPHAAHERSRGRATGGREGWHREGPAAGLLGIITWVHTTATVCACSLLGD